MATSFGYQGTHAVVPKELDDCDCQSDENLLISTVDGAFNLQEGEARFGWLGLHCTGCREAQPLPIPQETEALNYKQIQL